MRKRITITSGTMCGPGIATGQVTGAVKPKHRRKELRALVRQPDRAHPDRELHLAMDKFVPLTTPLR